MAWEVEGKGVGEGLRLCDAMRALSAVRIASGGSSEVEVEEECEIVAEVGRVRMV